MREGRREIIKVNEVSLIRFTASLYIFVLFLCLFLFQKTMTIVVRHIILWPLSPPFPSLSSMDCSKNVRNGGEG